MHELITIKDIFVVPFLLIFIYLAGKKVRNANINKKSYYKYFTLGLWAKVFAGLLFAFIYLFYYGGGDTVYYFKGSETIIKVFSKNIPAFFKILLGNHSNEIASVFDRNTGWSPYFRDPNSFTVCRINVPIYLLSMGSFLGNTILMNFILYYTIWKFYELLVELFPTKEKKMAYAVLFIPSVVFWSSGILKDAWMLSAILGMFLSSYNLFVKKRIVISIFGLFLWSYIAFSIRPFILYSTLGSLLVWVGFLFLKKTDNKIVQSLIFPVTIILIWLFGSLLFVQLSSKAGSRYSSIDSMLETAWIIQDDLKKDYYGGNSFDIGSFEPTIFGVLKKFPQAIVAGLFRPFIWEGNGPLMLLSGIENLIMLFIFIWILVKTRILKFFKYIFSNSFLLALFILFLSVGFSVGLTTSNFGSLVRYAIPAKLLFAIIFLQFFSSDIKADSEKYN